MSQQRLTPRASDDKVGTHALYKPAVQKKLWIVSLIGLALLTFGDLLIHGHPHFGIDGTFGFFSWYGFITCAAMVIVAKFVMGKILSRKDTYYDQR